MNQGAAAFWMTAVGTVCWVICFIWMGRISAKQNSLLDSLREQAQRIEKLSKMEHDMLKEVHPQVGEIKENIETVIVSVKESAEVMIAAVKEASDEAGRVAADRKSS
jgi:hypothetical protein